jgi:hypothetical protein
MNSWSVTGNPKVIPGQTSASRKLPGTYTGFGDIVPGVYPVFKKHSKSFSLIDCISVGVDPMQRNFDLMQKGAEAWQRSEVTGVTTNRK